jgi:hypothetical protein
MTMKRLFVLRHGKGGAVVLGEDRKPLYFDSKPEAKKARDTLGDNVVVSRGPDNRNVQQQGAN